MNAMNHFPGWVASVVRYSLICSAFALSTGCASQSPAGVKGAQDGASPGTAPGARPFDFDATIKREATGLSEHGVQAPDAAWSAKVPATQEPKLSRSENITLVDIPIGSDSAVRCQVFAETLDPGGTLSGLLKESAGSVEYRSIAPTGVSLIGGVPAAFLETVYVADTAAGKAAGGLKLAIQVREEESLLCLHDELGYKQTFKDVSTAFFASFKPKAPSPSVTSYTEMSKARLGDTDVGFSWTRIKPAEKAGEREYSYSNTTLIPTSPKDVVFEDSYEVYSYDAKSVLQAGTWVEARAGEITFKIGLKRGADGKYAYEGEVAGKPLKGVLQAPHGIVTSVDVAARLKKKLKAGAPFELVLSEYHPAIDPSALVAVTYRRQKGDPARQVAATMNDRTMTAEVDEDGMPKTTWFDVGKNRLTVERMKSEGHP